MPISLGVFLECDTCGKTGPALVGFSNPSQLTIDTEEEWIVISTPIDDGETVMQVYCCSDCEIRNKTKAKA